MTDLRGVIGVVNRASLEGALNEGRGAGPLDGLVGDPAFPHVHLDHSLDWALERMGKAKLDLLPVVGRDDVHQLLGVIALKDILEAYGVRADPEDPFPRS